MILQGFKFFESANSVKESNVLSANGNQLILQVSGNGAEFSISVLGKVDNENEDYTKLAVINAKDYDMLQSISSNGIYVVGIDGISKVKLSIDSITSGNVNVYGKVGD
jgi:hypothetical protein